MNLRVVPKETPMTAPKSVAEIAAEADAKARAKMLTEDLLVLVADDYNLAKVVQAQAYMIEIGLMQWFHRGAVAVIDKVMG